MITPITTHEQDAVDRVIEQYRDKPVIEAIIRAHGKQWQEIEVQTEKVRLVRAIEEADGANLDKIGKLVGQPRLGFGDNFYRILLYVKIGQNVSNGEPERVISVMGLIAETDQVHYMNLGQAELDVGIGTEPDPSLVDFIYQNMERVIVGGARLGKIISFDRDDPFAFDGPGEVSNGFGTLANPAEGGKFAFLLFRGTPFAFAGDDESADGFGTLADPLVGGRLRTL